MRSEPEPLRRAYARGPGEGRWVWWLGGAIRYLALGPETRGRYTANVSAVTVGGGPAPHVHSREIECFYLVDGGPVLFTAADRQVRLGARGFVALCPGTAHRFEVEGAGTNFLFCAPAGFDAFQMEAGEPIPDLDHPRPVTDEDKARVAATAPRYGVTMLPPDAYFAREPVAVVVQPGEGARAAAPGVTVRQLAEGLQTGGFFAMAEVELAPGAALDDTPPDGAEVGLFVCSGTVEAETEGRKPGGALARGAFAAPRSGTPLRLTNPGEGPAVLLYWLAPASRRHAIAGGDVAP